MQSYSNFVYNLRYLRLFQFAIFFSSYARRPMPFPYHDSYRCLANEAGSSRCHEVQEGSMTR